MPPALSDEEASDIEPQRAASWRQSVSADDEELLGDSDLTRNGAEAVVEVEDDEEDEDGDEDQEGELDEDEFIVEAIKKHMVDEDGSLKFLVKWEGWEKKSDMTWEPEDNLLESASEVLTEYYKQIGGRDKIFEESEKAARGKKRGRASSGGAAMTTTKRSRKNGLHPAESSPPATSKKWSPPAGSWEDEIESIDACEDEGSGRLVVYLIWKNGRKTKHDTSVIYKKCPQKMLQFYERHVKIIRDENKAAAE
ncbi:chromo shadow domain-containing protein [Hirsutella rhossiliensis]